MDPEEDNLLRWAKRAIYIGSPTNVTAFLEHNPARPTNSTTLPRTMWIEDELSNEPDSQP